MKIVKFLLLALGFYILYLTIRAAGIGNISGQIYALKWQLVPLLLIYPLIFAFDTLGWKYAFLKAPPKNMSFLGLYFIRIIGETFNVVIPWAASLGGEPLKADLLKSRYGIPLSQGVASILIVHTTIWISLNLFVIGGILVTIQTLPLTPLLWKSVTTFILCLGFAAILLFAGLQRGIFKRVHSIGEALKWWGPSSGEKKHRFLQLDDEIKKFYTANPKKFFLSSFFNFLAWFVGTFEVYFIARLIGIPLNLGEAWLLEALIQVLRIITFFIPASLGAQEGGIVLIFLQFGFENSVGLTFAIIRRIREIIWVGLGLILWFLMEDRPKFKTRTV